MLDLCMRKQSSCWAGLSNSCRMFCATCHVLSFMFGPHCAGGIWKSSFLSTVRPTVHTNPSRKWTFSSQRDLSSKHISKMTGHVFRFLRRIVDRQHLMCFQGVSSVFKLYLSSNRGLYIPLTNRVRGPHSKLRTEFFPPRFMAQARSARAINRRRKNEDP